jgi:apolipoprotein N-acyltransferase
VALVPLVWVLRTSRPGRGALLGLTFGVAYYGILLSWLIPFGVVAWLPLVVAQAAYAAGFGAVVPLLWSDRRPVRGALAVAALWTLLDWFRGSWPLGGFTWGGLAYTQHGNRLLLPLASVTGAWGITFVVMAVNVLAAAAIARTVNRGAPATRPSEDGDLRRTRERGPSPALLLVAIAAGLVVAPGAIPLARASGPALDVAVIQGNVPLALAQDRLLQGGAVWKSHVDLHRSLAGDPPDLAVWPENALDFDPVADGAAGEEVAAAIREVGSPTIVGAITDAPEHRFYNQALLYSGRGTVVNRYTKMHLVPFGEYVPWRPLFDWTDRYRPTSRDLAPGDQIRLFHVDGVTLASPICFENVFPNQFREFVADGAEVVVLITNDSSFRYSVASREHVIMSQFRAVETSRWIVQAAISGESAVVDGGGHVLAHTELFTPAVLRARVPSSTTRTIYTRLGDWFPWACGGAVALVLVVGVVRRRRGPGRVSADRQTTSRVGRETMGRST